MRMAYEGKKAEDAGAGFEGNRNGFASAARAIAHLLLRSQEPFLR